MEPGNDSSTDVGLLVDPSKLLTIDADGDVILEVGTSPKVRLLVSTKVLSVASDVLKALFSPRFSDGVKLVEKSVTLLSTLQGFP
jgi:hypothetical protein